jgi:hypothetical protein
MQKRQRHSAEKKNKRVNELMATNCLLPYAAPDAVLHVGSNAQPSPVTSTIPGILNNSTHVSHCCGRLNRTPRFVPRVNSFQVKPCPWDGSTSWSTHAWDREIVEATNPVRFALHMRSEGPETALRRAWSAQKHHQASTVRCVTLPTEGLHPAAAEDITPSKKCKREPLESRGGNSLRSWDMISNCFRPNINFKLMLAAYWVDVVSVGGTVLSRQRSGCNRLFIRYFSLAFGAKHDPYLLPVIMDHPVHHLTTPYSNHFILGSSIVSARTVADNRSLPLSSWANSYFTSRPRCPENSGYTARPTRFMNWNELISGPPVEKETNIANKPKKSLYYRLLT